MTTAQLKETPVASAHRQLGARMVDFAGWNMPVQYKSIITEHMAVRQHCGLFDVSHMGEFIVSGSGAGAFVQKMVANDVERLTEPDRALYTQFVNDKGGTVDDLIVYRRQKDFLLVVNASNIEKDWDWLKRHVPGDGSVALKDISEQTGLLALQGPQAAKLLSSLCGNFVLDMPSFSYAEGNANGIDISFGRTGYTGEDGFEIFAASDKAEALWRHLLDAGQAFGIEPAGLGARDTLRLEAGLPLYGHELDDETSPLEAGLGWSVKLEKKDFVGLPALRQLKEKGLPKTLVCLQAEGKALPRQGYIVHDTAGGASLGTVTSGSQGIFVGYPIAFAFVPPGSSKVGTQLTVAIRDSKVPARVVKRPWYKRP